MLPVGFDDADSLIRNARLLFGIFDCPAGIRGQRTLLDTPIAVAGMICIRRGPVVLFNYMRRGGIGRADSASLMQSNNDAASCCDQSCDSREDSREGSPEIGLVHFFRGV